MPRATCHCGAVVLEVPAAPTTVFECNCSICRRLGALWAYFPPKDVVVLSGPGRTRAYVWGDGTVEYHTCETCGCTTHWRPLDERQYSVMGVNARLFDDLKPELTEVRHLDNGGSGCFWIDRG